MKNLLFALVFVISLPSLAKDYIKKERQVASFSKVDVSGAFTVYFTQGSKDKLSVEASERVYNDIITEVRGSTLYIKMDRDFNFRRFNNPGKMTIYIQSNDLKALDISGACKFYGKNEINTSKLTVDMSGASTVEFEMNGDELDLDTSGASKINISGTVGVFNLESSGASSVRTQDLKAKRVDIEASGASSIKINVEESLKVESSGASSVRYYGNPEYFNVDASGAGSVKKLN